MFGISLYKSRVMLRDGLAQLRGKSQSHDVRRHYSRRALLLGALEDRLLLSATPVSPDVLVQEDFSDGVADGFSAQVGSWAVLDGRYHATPNGDAVSTLQISGPLPTDLQVDATINADPKSGTLQSNALVVFDYQSPTDFKFAGAYAGSDRWVIGHRTGSTWVTDAYINQDIHASTDYQIQVVIQNDSSVTLLVNGAAKVTHNFSGSLTDGAVGVGTWNAVAHFDDVVVSQYVAPDPGPSQILPIQEDFSDGQADFFQPLVGDWSVSDGRYNATPDGDAISTLRIDGPLSTNLELQATINADPDTIDLYSDALIIFDYQGPTDFKFAGAYARADRWVIGHRTSTTWVTDSFLDEPIGASTDYQLRVVIEDDANVSLWVNGVQKVARSYSGSLTDGDVGIGTWNAMAHFDDVLVRQYSTEPLPEPAPAPEPEPEPLPPPVVEEEGAEAPVEEVPPSEPVDMGVQIKAIDERTFQIIDDGILVDTVHVHRGMARIELADADDLVTIDLQGFTTRGHLLIDLGDGNNCLTVQNGSIDGHLTVRGGDGDDSLLVASGVSIAKHAKIELGDGNNDFTLAGLVQRHLELKSGDGEDTVHIQNSAHVGRHAKLQLGAGDDSLWVDGYIGQSLNMDSGNGSDAVELHHSAHIGFDAKIRLGDGNNHLSHAGHVARDFWVRGGKTDDTIELLDSASVGRAAPLDLGGGDDRVSLAGEVGHLLVNAGAGNDTVELLSGAHVGGFAVLKLGKGDDSFSHEGHVGMHLLVDGGRGTDTALINGTAKNVKLWSIESGLESESVEDEHEDKHKHKD